MKRILLAAVLLIPSQASAHVDLTAAIAGAYFARTETPILHELAHQRAAYQVTYSGGTCADSPLTHDGATTAEVLACNHDGAERAVEQWQGSPTHDAILSDPVYTAIGCGSAAGTDGALFSACVLAAEPVEAARTPHPTPVGSIPTSGATPAPMVSLPDTATRDHVTLVGALILAVGLMLVIHSLAEITSHRRSQVRPRESGTEPRRTEAQSRTQRARGGDS